MADKMQRFEVKVYGVSSATNSGRKKIGETAIVEGKNMIAATRAALDLVEEGVPADQHAGLHSINVKLDVPKATEGNPFGSKS